MSCLLRRARGACAYFTIFFSSSLNAGAMSGRSSA
jgi:hypothetical protein